jgi:hypothetical protein
MQFVVPEPRDILCGRGITCHQHQGNKLLRQLIDRNLPKYTVADSKSDKSSILREIIRNILQQGGRFLKKDSESDRYYEAGMKAARCVKLPVPHCIVAACSLALSGLTPSSSILPQGQGWTLSTRGNGRENLKNQTILQQNCTESGSKAAPLPTTD